MRLTRKDLLPCVIGCLVGLAVYLSFFGCSLHLGEKHYHYSSREAAAAHADPAAVIDNIFQNAAAQETVANDR